MLSARYDRQLPDVELIARYKDTDDVSIVGILYDRYMTLVYGVCMKYLKDREESRDAVMQIFEKLISSLKEHEITHFKSWLYTTSRNHCLMALRARKRQIPAEIEAEFMENGALLHLDDGPNVEVDLVKLEHCIDRLVAEQKACVEMFYLQQKCYKEIVTVTGFDDKKVKSYIQNGKRNLKLCMERNG